MKIPLVCSQCMIEDITTASPLAIDTFRDDGRYEVHCPKGHTSIIVLQQQKFEILYDIGAYAILDGYYREAVSSFTSSLERFYDFFIKSLLYEKGIEEKVVNESWNQISKQSERQLGAFIFLYTREFYKSPKLLSQSLVTFRNDVVHNGKIPTRDEAINYGQAVLEVIRPILCEVKENFPKGVHRVVFLNLAKRKKNEDQNRSVATMSIPTIISLTNAELDHDNIPLEKAIQRLYRWSLNAKSNTLELSCG